MSVPVLAEAVLAATVNVTVPVPLPLDDDVNVIQDAWLAAVHAHPADVEIVIAEPAPPAAPMD
jgi:hypothetical protein